MFSNCNLVNNYRSSIDSYIILVVIFLPLCLIISNHPPSKSEVDYTADASYNEICVLSSMKSIQLKHALAVVLSLSSFLLLEVITDNVSNPKNIFSVKGSLTNFSILLTLLLSSIFNFFVAIPLQHYQLMYGIYQARNIVILCMILSYANRSGRSSWKDQFLLMTSVIGCIGTVLRVTSLTGPMINPGSPEILDIIGASFQTFFSVILLIYIIRWYIYLYHDSYFRDITTDEWNTTLYSTIGMMIILILWLFKIFFGEMEFKNYSSNHLLAIELSYVFFIVIFALHQTRSIRRESNKRRDELEFKRMFVRYISHEVRTPLNTATMGLQVLSEELINTASHDTLDTVKDIKTSCDIAVTTLNELLTFDKLEAGTLMVEKTQFNAFQFLQETVGPFQIQARKLTITLSVRIKQQFNYNVRLAVLSADKNKMSQIIRNMVSNGLKFTPPGGTVDVLVDVVDGTAEDGRACKMLKVDVVDSGAGISPENQKRLFKEIVQFNPGKLQKGGGSGLGLYISYGIAKLHGGRLSVHSKGEGHGCTFTLLLPILPVDKLESPEIASNRVIGIYNMESIRSDGSSSRHSIQAFTSLHLKSNSTMDSVKMSKIGNSVKIMPLVCSSSSGSGNISDVQAMTTASYSHHILSRISNNKVANMPSENNNNNITSEYVLSTIESEFGGECNVIDSSKTHMSMSMNRDMNIKNMNVHTTRPHPERTSASMEEEQFEEKNDNDNNNDTKTDFIVSLPSIRNLRMLVVDDSAMSRKMQCRLLRKRCVSCIEAENGQEAVDKVKMAMTGGEDGINPIDLIIMDCNMPVMNGMDAAKMMRDMGYKRYIIGVTGNVSTEDIDAYISHGADVVLAKPLDIEKFDIAVSNLMLLHQ